MSLARGTGITLLLALAANITACGTSSPPEPPREEHKDLQRAIQQPIDRARAVQDEVQKQQESLQRQVDESGG